MSSTSAEGEVGTKQAGVLYPLVVAAQAQTRLPLASELVPSEQDLRRSLYWSSVVGLGLGLLWSLVGVVCTALGLSMFATAAIIVVVMIVCGGLCFERALATKVAELLRRQRETVGQEVPRDDAQVVMVAVICLSVVLHVAALASIHSHHLSAALLAAAVLSRWVLSLGPLMVLVRSGEKQLAELVHHMLLATVVATVVVACLGGSGLLRMALVGGLTALLLRNADDVSQHMSTLLSVALLAEVLVLLA